MLFDLLPDKYDNNVVHLYLPICSITYHFIDGLITGLTIKSVSDCYCCSSGNCFRQQGGLQSSMLPSQYLSLPGWLGLPR